MKELLKTTLQKKLKFFICPRNCLKLSILSEHKMNIISKLEVTLQTLQSKHSLTDTAVSSDLTNEVLPSQFTCESASKEAFFARLETFTSLKWAGKPLELSPLECAKYGWINIETDMLKCCTCGAFLCATLQPTMDLTKYNERQAELLNALSGAHEKFCFWPDSPSPARFCNLPIEDKSAILTGYLNRFQELWCLDRQLPSLKYDDLKDMPLTEDSVNSLLLLVAEHLKQREEDERLSVKQGPESLPAHVVAIVLAVCGWSSSIL
ncbi:nuclear-interacting partner of ALK-like [Protopterus annectens]|uniref:nuclear-interacting partner of ALK-like n=1 Tax=Protopterus annectens TaxID=7888 RepID=UPI001CFAC6ED|nr:nuclear-interacting partner of ALK-like [Protopterus annectens]